MKAVDLMQSLYFLAEALDGMQQIFYLCGPGTDGLSLKVVAERLVELRPAADSLGHEQRNYGCRIPLQHLSLLPFPERPMLSCGYGPLRLGIRAASRDQSRLILCRAPALTAPQLTASTERSTPKTPP